MKILYFTRDDSVHDRRFLSAMVSAGMNVFLLRLQGGAGPLVNLPKGVKEVHWQDHKVLNVSSSNFNLIKNLQSVIRDIKPDLIHAGLLTSCANIAARSGFQPLVSMSWGSDILTAGWLNLRKKRMLKQTLEQTSVLIGDCEAVRQKAIAFGFPAERIVVFPWGVDLKLFSPGSEKGLRKKWGWEKEFILLSLRSWEPIHGVDVVVKAFLKAAKEVHSLRLLLGGTGSQESRIRLIVEKSGIQDRVRFLGQIDQALLPQIYRAADLYVSASHSDGSSVSLMEALACGKPVLVSNIAGNQEWITDGQNGWLFRDGDIRQLVDSTAAISQNKASLIKMGSDNRKLAKQRADWERNSKGLIQAYKMALDLKGAN